MQIFRERNKKKLVNFILAKGGYYKTIKTFITSLASDKNFQFFLAKTRTNMKSETTDAHVLGTLEN